jgi:hypothetical protein
MGNCPRRLENAPERLGSNWEPTPTIRPAGLAGAGGLQILGEEEFQPNSSFFLASINIWPWQADGGHSVAEELLRMPWIGGEAGEGWKKFYFDAMGAGNALDGYLWICILAI